MKTAALRNLGCKVNAYETEGMRQILQQNGYSIVPFDNKADIYIVNTCSVTNIADQKSRQMLHRAKRQNPEAIVVAAGCYVQTGYEKLLKDTAVDLIVGNNEKRNIALILEEYFENQGEGKENEPKASDTDKTDAEITDSKVSGSKHVPNMSEIKEYEEMQVISPAEHTRGFIKIQDGCNRFCTYCVIPYARGRVRSRLIEDIVAEAEALAAGGCREVVITGIHISSFGTDRGSSELLKLLERMNRIEGILRIRLSSLEPGIITEEFAEGIKRLNKVCPHFHLSLQSGSDSVLSRMNRHYTCGEYMEKVKLLRRIYDRPAITTDIIAGFPGETEEEFEQTCDFVREIDFYEVHVFKYSRRDGTKAADMPEQVSAAKKSERSEKLISMTTEMSKTYRKAHIGEIREILIEEKKKLGDKNYWVGYTPEYIMTAFPETIGDDMENSVVKGRLKDFSPDNTVLLAEPYNR